MFQTDLLIAFTIMALLFLRQIAILKQPNKIDYAPLMLAVGTLSSIIHFMIHPHTNDLLLLSQESLFPLLVGVILYIVMNILHQTQVSLQSITDDEFSIILVQEINELKSFILDLEKRMNTTQSETVQTQREIREKFIEDIKILNTIEDNQKKFLEKFLKVEDWHEDVKKSFIYFSEEQLPKLDDVVHKHIDILRISEKDHYNKLQELLKKAVESRFDISDEVKEVQIKLDNINTLATNVTDKIVTSTTEKLSFVMKDFEKDLLLLKSNSGVVATSLHESENSISNLRKQSEIIINDIINSAETMEELADVKSKMSDLFKEVTILIDELDRIKSDYVKSQAQLSMLTRELQMNSNEELNAMSNKFNRLSEELCEKIDSSLENLYKHYHIVGEDVTKQANLLAKKAQIQNGYSKLEG